MINRLFRKTWFPLVFQLVMFAVFILIMVGGFLANTDDMKFAKVLRNTNFANLMVWSYWWPLIIIASIFIGRIWCTVCPMELVTSLASMVGLKRKPSPFIRSGWLITIFYILILFIGIHTLAIHRVPYRMAIYMVVLFAMAVMSGLIYSRNTFCAHICPIGHLLGLYGRIAPFGWGVRDKSVCESCKDISCVSRKTAYEFQGRSCGVGLKPATLDDNTECLLCGQCLKACDRNNPGQDGRPNPGWFRRGWFKDLFELKPMTASQTLFCLIVSGFVIYEIFTEWGTTLELLLWLPSQVGQAVGVSGSLGTGMIKSLTLFVVLPFVIWVLPFSLYRLMGGHLKLSDYMLRFGIAFVPIMAAAHIIKSLLKMTSRLPYWEYVYSDPLGIDTASGIIDKSIQLSALPVWRDPFITITSLGLMLVGVILSIVLTKKLIKKSVGQAGLKSVSLYLIPGLYGGGFSAMLIAWRLF
jgi:4Fe-4S binding domain